MSDFHDETQGRDEGRPPMEYDVEHWDAATDGAEQEEAAGEPETPRDRIVRRAAELTAESYDIIQHLTAIRAARWQTWLNDMAVLVKEAREAGVSLPPKPL